MEQRRLGMGENLPCSIFHSQLIGRRYLSQWNTSSIVRRLKLVRQLSSHSGCVNTIQFDTTGNLLLSGSDDKMLKIFDPKRKRDSNSALIWSFQTQHFSNIFSASFLKGCTYAVSCSRDGRYTTNAKN